MSATVSSSSPRTEPVSHVAVLDWIAELRMAMCSAWFSELLDFDGVNVVDVLLSPLYLAALTSLRNGDVRSPTRPLMSRAREWAYSRKMRWQQRLQGLRATSVSPSDIVLWTRDITHTVNMQPVAVALRERGVASQILSSHSKAFHQPRGGRIDAIQTGRAWPHIVRDARKDGFNRAMQLAAVGHWPVPRFDHELAGRLEQSVRRTVVSQLPYISETIATARAALDYFGCRVLVVGNDLTMEGRAGCRVAASRGIPSAVFMHGSITGAPLHALHCADRLLVFGDGQRRELVRLGIPDEHIIVCGAPSLDHVPRQNGTTHPLLQQRLGLRQGEPWILVATSGPGHSISHAHHDRVVANLVQLSAALPDVPVVVKLHRKDRLRYYRRGLRARSGGRFFVVPYGTSGFPPDIFDWLGGCSMVLTGASSVAIEAMLMDVPVITMDYCNEVKGADFIDARATVHVETFEALKAAVCNILTDGAPDQVRQHVRDYLKDAFLALDGGSASRGADALCELANLAGQ